jgi:hypothetical protein
MKGFQILDKEIGCKAPKIDYRERKDVTVLSFSQLSKYWTCPHSWKLKYVDGHYLDKPNIHVVYGSAIHEVLQTYIYTMFIESVKKADQLDLKSMLIEEMSSEYLKQKKSYGKDFLDKDILLQYWKYGVAIIDEFRRKRSNYFNMRHHELVGIEVPIYYPLLESDNTVYLLSYLDVVIKDKRDNEVTIIDLKTSTKGWNKYKKKDKITTSQLPLYKKYFSRQYDIPIENIKIEYLILKNTLYEDIEYPQSRLQTFSPASGKVTLNKIDRALESFLEAAYDDNGRRDKSAIMEAIQGEKEGWNCTFCPYKDRPSLCPPEKRLLKKDSFE